jgi:hypothetical protein
MANFSESSRENPGTADGNTPRNLVAQIRVAVPDSIVASNVEMLRVLSCCLSQTICETEINSLFACAAHRAAIDCPGWRPRLRTDGGDLEYDRLCRCLANYDVERASSLMNALWDALIDQLTRLIGEYLTLLQFRRALRLFLDESPSTTDAG